MDILQIFAWPIALIVAVLVFSSIFWKPIAGLINRVQRAAVGDKAIEFGEQRRAEQQLEQQRELEVATPATAATVVAASHAMPPPHEAYAPMEEHVRAALPTDRAPEVERAWLIRALVVSSVLRTHDAVYRAIFGSQLGLLLQANTSSPPNMEQARAMYDAAAANFTEMYADFSFDAWLDFPMRMALLRVEPVTNRPAVIRVTPLGRDFLHYLVNSGLTQPKPG